MDAVKFLKERKRMCHFSGDTSCHGCPLYKERGIFQCLQFQDLFPEQTVNIIEKWVKEHPRETRKDDFFEKFPHAKKISDGIPEVCAAKVGYLRECPHPNVEDYCKECWNTPLEEE